MYKYIFWYVGGSKYLQSVPKSNKIPCLLTLINVWCLLIDVTLFDSESKDLEVYVEEARELVINAESSQRPNTSVRVFLLPDKTTNMQTRVRTTQYIFDIFNNHML